MSRVPSLWRLLNLPCQGMARLASESFDRDLILRERVTLRLHLAYCAPCRHYEGQLQLLRCAMRRLASRLESDQPLPGPGLPEEVRERIKRALKES
jgi:hypothetical protein